MEVNLAPKGPHANTAGQLDYGQDKNEDACWLVVKEQGNASSREPSYSTGVRAEPCTRVPLEIDVPALGIHLFLQPNVCVLARGLPRR